MVFLRGFQEADIISCSRNNPLYQLSLNNTRGTSAKMLIMQEKGEVFKQADSFKRPTFSKASHLLPAGSVPGFKTVKDSKADL